MQIHPAAAAAMGITDGAEVSVANERGEVVCRAELSTAIRPETVFLPFHFPELESANRLTEAATDPISGNARIQVQQRLGPAGSDRTRSPVFFRQRRPHERADCNCRIRSGRRAAGRRTDARTCAPGRWA